MGLSGATRRFNTMLKRKSRMPAATAIDSVVRENPVAAAPPTSGEDEKNKQQQQQEKQARVSTDSNVTVGQPSSSTSPPPITSLSSDVKSKLSTAGSATSDDILIARLAAWKRLIKVYEDYFDAIIAAEKTSKKSIEKALADFEVPLKEERLFLSIEEGGVQQMSSHLKEVHAMYAAQHAKLVQGIESDALVLLEQLRVEVKDNVKLYTDHLAPIYRRLRKQAKEVDEHKEKLVKAVEAYKNKHRDQDAWLIQQQIRRELTKQAEVENSLHKAVQAEYSRMAKWEVTVTERLKTMAATLVSHDRDSARANIESIGGFLAYMENFNAGAELQAFDAKFGPVLKQPMGLNGNSKLADYDYMYRDSESTQVLLEGQLEREKGVLKRFQPAYTVLTKLGYLHCFATQEDLLASDPDATFHLSECSVSPLDQKNSFVLFVSDKKVGRSKYAFKASDRAYIEHWWNAISSITNSKPKTKANEIVGGSLRDSRDAAAAAALAATNAPNTLPTAAGVTVDELAARNAQEDEAAAQAGAEGAEAKDVGDAKVPSNIPARGSMPNPEDFGGVNPAAADASPDAAPAASPAPAPAASPAPAPAAAASPAPAPAVAVAETTRAVESQPASDEAKTPSPDLEKQHVEAAAPAPAPATAASA
ncbi:hypothetical protein GQ54DRAFT_313572 [Martensiomyces pterosporus]|nr:hypothetical protein GQ54DRAFT_313572 [Martensiomyces pterosporus]